MGPSSGSGLMEPTLVLNKSWVPINTTTVRRALILVAKGAARFIQTESYELHDFQSWLRLRPQDETSIRGVEVYLRIPEVVVLTRYNRLPGKSVPFSRRNLYRRDGSQCQYCGEYVATRDMTVDHVVPRARGGANSWENCVLSCQKCNSRKGSRCWRDVGLNLLREPRRPEWSPCITIKKGQRKDSWRRFVSDRQWLTGFDH